MYMHQLSCDCCGFTVVSTTPTQVCPRCQYPIQPEQEQRFLEAALHDLKRVMQFGGASLSVRELVRRYERRLQILRAQEARGATQYVPPPPPQTKVVQPPSQVVRSSERIVLTPPPSVITAPSVATPPVAPDEAPDSPIRSFAVSSDAVINILAALGGFFVLVGSLSFVLTTTNLRLSFLAVFVLHAIFGGAGQLTRRRLPLLRAVSSLYTMIFALLVPLVGFSAYRLVTNGLVELSPSALLMLAALYASAIYIVLAITQRFVPFAYLGMVALLVADLALALSLHVAYWWWPCIMLLLALPALWLYPGSAGEPEPLAGAWIILRLPFTILMYTVISIAWSCLFILLNLILPLDSIYHVSEDVHVALFSLSALLWIWTALWIWRMRYLKLTPVLAYLLVGVLVLLGYALNFDRIGYVLLLTSLAFGYRFLTRTIGVWLARYHLLDLTLDQLTVGLSALIVVLVAFATPFQLLSLEYPASPIPQLFSVFIGISPHKPFILNSDFVWTQLVLCVCLLLTLDISVMRAGLARIPAHLGWCWGLLLSGLLFMALYAQEVLLWHLAPLWAWLALSLVLLTSAVLVRRFVSAAWAKPLDVLALSAMVFTLLLSLRQTWEVLSALLLGWAALLYLVAFAQDRGWFSLLTAGLLLLAIPVLLGHPFFILGLSLALPLLAISMQRAGLFAQKTDGKVFAWVLFGSALLYGLSLTGRDISSSQSTLVSLWGLHVPLASDLVVLGVTWYVTALLTGTTYWLIPATLFWLFALLWPVDDFWTVSVLTALSTLGAVGIGRRTRSPWAIPFYLATFCGVLMVIYTGLTQGHVMALSWVLLAFAILATGLGLSTGRLDMLWLTPFFATGAVVVAAALLGDLYRPPIIALVCAAVGLALSRTPVLTMFARCQQKSLSYALPFYTTALLEAGLTGLYGMAGNINRPFYGALPTALLIYAVVAFVIVVIEQQPSWNWLAAILACWAMLLAARLSPFYLLDAGLASVLLGLASGRLLHVFLRGERPTRSYGLTSVVWNWPWYATFLVAACVLASWPYTLGHLVAPSEIAPMLLVFTLLAVVVMLVERIPEFLILPVGMAAWTIHLWFSPSQPALVLVAYTLLCILIFLTQFTWRALPASTHWWPEASMYNALSLGGLGLIVLVACGQGALSADAGGLAHAGAFALGSLSLLLFLYGFMYPSAIARTLAESLSVGQRTASLAVAYVVRQRCAYGAGLLFSLTIAWELLAFHVTQFDVLTVPPATYLIVVAPFLLHDSTLPERHTVGQLAALLGAALLLLPTLWLSFNGSDVLPTLILLGEALLLLLMGFLTRLRVFILSSTALIVVATLRLLFLSLPPSGPILLMVFGCLLVLLATVLMLLRHRLQVAWSHWE